MCIRDSYDTVEDADGKQKRVLNKKETTLAQQKQQAIKAAFQNWVWKDPYRRAELVEKYNELFNSCLLYTSIFETGELPESRRNGDGGRLRHD